MHHPDHVDRVVQSLRHSFETGAAWEDTFPLRGRDGNYRWFLSRALPIRNEAGEVVRWFGTNTDVTAQLEAEKALRELNEMLQQRVAAETRERVQLWNVSQDLLLVTDEEGSYLSVNPAWTATLGWSELELLGRTSQWLQHPDDRERTRAEINNLAAGRKTLRFENRFRHFDGGRDYCLRVCEGLMCAKASLADSLPQLIAEVRAKKIRSVGERVRVLEEEIQSFTSEVANREAEINEAIKRAVEPGAHHQDWLFKMPQEKGKFKRLEEAPKTR